MLGIRPQTPKMDLAYGPRSETWAVVARQERKLVPRARSRTWLTAVKQTLPVRRLGSRRTALGQPDMALIVPPAGSSVPNRIAGGAIVRSDAVD